MRVSTGGVAKTWAYALGLVACSGFGSELPMADGVALTNHPHATTIGLLVPKDETQAMSLQEGVSLAVADANRDQRSFVTAVIRGALGQWGADGVEAARMVTDDEARGLIAPPGGAGSHLALQVSGRTATPVVSLCADSSVTKTGVPWMVRITPRTTDEARTLWGGLELSSDRMSRWAVVVPTERAGREIAHDMARAAADANLPLPTVIETDASLENMDSLCRRAAILGKDAVLIWLGPVPAGRLVRALRNSGFGGPLAGPGRLRCAEFLGAASTKAEGFRVAAPILISADRVRLERFASGFRAKFGREPDAMAAMSYDAARLLIQVLETCGEREPHTEFPLTKEFPGVTGVLRFDSEGNRKVALEVLEVRSGRFTAIEH